MSPKFCQSLNELQCLHVGCAGSPGDGGHGPGKGSPTWFSDLSEDMRSASTGLMLLDDIDETEEV